MITGAYCKLRDGAVGVRCGEGVQIGASVTVRDTTGYLVHAITSIETTDHGISYCRIDGKQSSPIYNQRSNRRVQCLTCNGWYPDGGICPHCGE